MTGDEELAKDLGLVSALAIGIGTMIGAGIFVLPGVAANAAGPIVVVSFIIGGVIAMINGLAVSELGTAMPKAGGAYYYINSSLGPLFGSIAGMGDWMGLAFASAFYCIGFGQYLAVFVGLPAVAFLNPIQVGALLAGVAFVGVNYIGAKETGGVQTLIVIVLLSILTVFAAVGFFSFDYATLLGEGGLAPTDTGYGAILPGTALVFVSFLGYAKIATVAEELKNPGRNLPLAIIGSVALVTIIYTILVTLMLGIVPWNELSQEAPVAQAAEIAFPAGIAVFAAAAMTIGALLATASSANASILASARINFAMGREKIVTNWLNEVHSRYATPYRSILVTGGLIIAFIALLGRDIAVLAKAASVLHLVVYALMNAALIVFREANVSEYDPDFTVPLYPITPILGIVFSLGLIGFMEAFEIAMSAAFVVAAVVWYFVYARSRTTREGVLSEYVLSRADEMPDAAVAAASGVRPDGGDYRVLVPLANPEHEEELVTLAGAVAKHHAGVVDAVHIVTVPDQTSLEYASEHLEEHEPHYDAILEDAKQDAEALGVDVETHTIVSHRGFEEIFDAARTHDADTVVMGWGPDSHGSPGRAESSFDELVMDLPCDFLVVKDRGFAPEHIVVPTKGGPGSAYAAEIASLLQSEYGSEVTLLHVADSEAAAEDVDFLEELATECGLDDATLQVETGDVASEVVAATDDASLVIVGASERGLLARLVRGSPVGRIVNEVDCSVILAEQTHDRSLRQRLFG